MPLREFVARAIERGASDVHLSVGEPPLVRIDGDLRHETREPLRAEHAEALLAELTTDAQRATLASTRELDAALDIGSARCRLNAFFHRLGLGLALRLLPAAIPKLASLCLPRGVEELTRLEKGLVLVVGPTGSGKSTTLASMLDRINEEQSGHIVTIEDPIEYVHASRRCLVQQREVGVHTATFDEALRRALRQDPDVLLVGEMRDLETIRLALTASETGHLVFATLHAPDASQAIDRIVDAFPAGEQGQVRTQLAGTLEAVLGQTLCKRRGGGRLAAVEILRGTTAVRNLIREGKTHQLPSMMQTGQREGMQTMHDALATLRTSGLLDGAPPIGVCDVVSHPVHGC